MDRQIEEKKRRLTNDFTQAGVYARRQFCADLEAYHPQDVQLKPPPS